MRDQQEPDMETITGYVRQLLEEFPHPETGRALPGLLSQAWNASNLLLTSKSPGGNDGGSAGKPGSRPPCSIHTWAHVQACWDMARTEADDLGVFFATDRAEEALKRLPALLEPTYDQDCQDCERCRWGTKKPCVCRHRKVTKRVTQSWATLGADLWYWDHPTKLPYQPCPACKRTGGVVVRKDQERIYCQQDGCDWAREGVFAIICEAQAS